MTRRGIKLGRCRRGHDNDRASRIYDARLRGNNSRRRLAGKYGNGRPSAQGDLPVMSPGRPLVAGRSEVSSRGGAQVGGEPLRRLLQGLRAGAEGGPQTGAGRPCARNMPTNPGPLGQPVLPAACSRATSSRGGPPGPGITQRRCSFAPTSVQYAASTVVSRAVGEAAGWPAPGPRPALARSVSGTSAIQKSNRWTVTSSASPVTRSCSRGPRRRVGETDDAGLGLQRPLSTAPRSRAGSPKWCCTCSPSQISRCRGPSPAPPSAAKRAQLHLPVTVAQRERGGRGRHELAHRDDVALRGSPRRGGSRTGRARRQPRVAGLVALAGPARAGLPRA